MASIQKLDREMSKKAKAQQKRQRKRERRQATAKASQNPGTTESISPSQNSKGAIDGDLRAHHHRVARG